MEISRDEAVALATVICFISANASPRSDLLLDLSERLQEHFKIEEDEIVANMDECSIGDQGFGDGPALFV